MATDWTARPLRVDEDVPIPLDEDLPESEILDWLDEPDPQP